MRMMGRLTARIGRSGPVAGLYCVLLFASPRLLAQNAVYEIEPNDTPTQALAIEGEVNLLGGLSGSDQDAYLWTVTDEGARERWTFELAGVPGRLTIVQVMRLEYAENGVDVTGRENLLTLGSRDGAHAVVQADLLFEPGEYLLGVAGAGGGEGGIFRPPTATLSFGEGNTAAGAQGVSGGYRLDIRQGNRVPLPGRSEARASREQAYEVRPGRETAAFLPGESHWYAFPFQDKDATQRWDIEAQVPVGRSAQARLVDAAGQELTGAHSGADGKLALRDLAPPVGTWWLEVKTGLQDGQIHLVSARSTGARVAGEEAEPNDAWETANRTDFSQPVQGRFGSKGESDWYLFTLDEARSDSSLSLVLDNASRQKLELCLLNAVRQRLQCRESPGTLRLPGLFLAPGDYFLSVARGSEGTQYSIRLEAEGPLQPGFEAEPNDYFEFPGSVPDKLRIKGHFSGDDIDHFRFVTTEAPQLWRIQVMGDQVAEVSLLDIKGSQVANIRPQRGQRRVTLDNVYLLPGVHHVRVRGGDGGDYTLLARPLGPPDPNAEREPNDDESRMERLDFGQVRTGLLSETQDQDLYRLFLGNWEHLRLTIRPAADGSVEPYLYWYGTPVFDGPVSGVGQPIVLDGLFPPGDYHLSLKAQQVSEAEYSVGLERLPRFSCAADCEPNGSTWFTAAPLPPSLVLEGRADDWRDADVYQLPVFDHPVDITVSIPQPKGQVKMAPSWMATDLLQRDTAAGVYRGVIPPGSPQRLYLHRTDGDYRVELTFPNGEVSAREAQPLPAKLGLSLEHAAVAAYRPYGQRVTGRIGFLNTGPDALRARLEAVSSDYRWQVRLDETDVTAAPGERSEIPFEVLAPADAWADRPVRISVRAVDAQQRQAEAFVDITVGRDASPVQAFAWWETPESLRGGFNVALTGLGGALQGEYTSAWGSFFEKLFDDRVASGIGMSLRGWKTEEEFRDITVRLAGDQPAPVAGFAFNLFGTKRIENALRKAELHLSLDGQVFDKVADVELQPVLTEQYIVLDTPIPARFARLRPLRSFDAEPGRGIELGEWKIIAEPGFDPTAGQGYNLADPELGGHIVWSTPGDQVTRQASLLTSKQESPEVRTVAGSDTEWVVAFQHNRAARIASIGWQYGPRAPAEKRFDKVAVAVALDSPTGPWRALGEWPVAADQPESFKLQQPVWARFVKFSAPASGAREWRSLPDSMTIRETPISTDYRSALSEWGSDSVSSFYEFQAGLEATASQAPAANLTRSGAAQLTSGQPAAGVVVLGERENWYRLQVPGDANSLQLSLQGDPTVRTVPRLESEAGEPLALRQDRYASNQAQHVYETVVTPGSTVYINIQEPPRNIVFSWDTSASVNPYIPMIYDALAAFADQVVPGHEAVNLAPFGRSLLLKDWYGEPYMLQTILNDYPRGESSSDAERTLRRASQAMEILPGAKSILLITDALTTRDGDLWAALRQVQPRVFGIGAGGDGSALPQDLFQDWASVNGGHYRQLVYRGEMEVAMDRALTMLRRPAEYSLAAEFAYQPAPGPGQLQVNAGDGNVLVGGAGVELILDASGSMLQRLDGKRRIAMAKDVLTEAVSRYVPPGTPLALRVFGHREPNACRTDLEIPLAALDPAQATATIAGINAMNLARTPIADSLAAIEDDLKSVSGRSVIVLVTDGEETCEGDPAAVITRLQDKGVDISLNIVGFAIGDAELETQFRQWAELGNGRYFSARDQVGLDVSLQQALSIPFSVIGAAGEVVAEGLVGGEAVELPQGDYTVHVATAPPRTFERIEITGGKTATLELE